MSKFEKEPNVYKKLDSKDGFIESSKNFDKGENELGKEITNNSNFLQKMIEKNPDIVYS